MWESLKPIETLEDEDVCAPSNDGMSLTEKMGRWYTAQPSEVLPGPVADEQGDQVQVPPRYQEVRSFLLKGPAYQWLLKSARSSAHLTERRGTAMESISRKIDATLSSMERPKSRLCPIFRARFDVDWDLQNFLRGQEYDTTLEIALERAITVTGSARDAQALSCMDYMCQTWPSSGRAVVHAFQKALRSPELSCTST